MSAPRHLFFYGTLLTGTGNRLVDDTVRACCRSVGRGFICAKLYDLGRFPGAVPSDDETDKVYGSIYRLRYREAECLRILDRYEAYFPQSPGQSVFVRIAINAFLTSDQAPVPCWVYFYRRWVLPGRRIESGDYLESLSSRGGGEPFAE
jgi:Uncharacterized conserved protein